MARLGPGEGEIREKEEIERGRDQWQTKSYTIYKFLHIESYTIHTCFCGVDYIFQKISE
jgi:hypothetical protein